jgi:hypothetical protein
MLDLRVLALWTGAVVLGACAGEAVEEDLDVDEPEIVSSKDDDHWFYGGPIPQLKSPQLTVSLAGHTVHVEGRLPAGTDLPPLPHVKTRPEDGMLRVDIVYPIATARPGKSNSRPGTYAFELAKPYRPDGLAFTQSEGSHFVTWGGFPFLAYNQGIAFHGPITDRDNKNPGALDVWYLQRGEVSGGCNRMMGEHVVELAHVIGINMRKVYEPNKIYDPTTRAKVDVIKGYDTYGSKLIDVDYPTDVGATRPAAVHGADRVVMWGSWILGEMPNGKDLPPDMKWEGGENGNPYAFREHASGTRDWVCSMPKETLPKLRAIAARTNGTLPRDFCAKKRDCDRRLGRTCKASEIL